MTRAGCTIDVGGLARGIGFRPFARVSRRFGTSLLGLVAAVCARRREQSGLARGVLSGGVLANAILASEIPERLRRDGFEMFSHRKAPPNDGGSSLGLLAVAAHGGGVRGSLPKQVA